MIEIRHEDYLFACVSEILIDPGYRRLGLGRRWMDAALALAARSSRADDLAWH